MVLEDFFHRTPPSIFVVTVNRFFYDNNEINHQKR